MARYTGADCKRCRREKMKLFLKGAKCESPKCPIEIRPYPPGEHGRGRTKDSEYLLQKREKQKCARIYGVLEKQFRGYYEEAGVGADTYVRDLTEDEVVKLRELIDGRLMVEGDLRRDRQQNVKRLQEIGSYRGLRHRRGLPVHGQNTKTNARTRKGPKRMQVAGKKKATKK